jgi:hypothetical protein
MIRNASVRLGIAGLILVAGVCSPLWAQGAPQTYSFTQDPAIPLMGPMVVTLSRDGAKEVVDQVFPPSTAQPKGFHAHLVYDFQAHKIYTQIMSDPSVPCSVMTYASPGAPAEFDVISGAADLIKELTSDAKEPMKKIGAETVDGLATTIFEENGSGGKGKVWIADQGGYPLKVVSVGADGKEETIIEVKQLSFAKPAAAKFTPPAGCQEVAGTATATGVSTGDAPETSPKFKVTAATLAAIGNYKGVCPAKIKMTGTITTDGPGTVWYWFSAGSSDPGQELKFDAAGTKTVTHTMIFNPKYGSMGAGALLQAVMEDAKGNHAPAGTGSNNANFSIDCMNMK